MLLTEHLVDSPITAHHILSYVQQGWPNHCEITLATDTSKRNELSVHHGCLMWGSRVIVHLADEKPSCRNYMKDILV